MKLLIELSEDTLNNILWHGLNISPHHEKELLNAIRKPLSFKEPKQGEWIDTGYGTSRCSVCGEKCQTYCMDKPRDRYCLWCGASMSANDRQVTGKLNSETEYKAKVKELEDAIAKCEKAEKEFKSRTCKFRSPINCDFCAFHSDCNEHWREGEAE